MKRLLACAMMSWVMLISSMPPTQGQTTDPVVQCRDVAKLAKRACALQAENAILNVGGAAALACVSSLFAGNLTASIVCLVAFGIAALIAINIYETYHNCVAQADLQEDICIESVCT